jgi:hypothetical protein
MTPAAQSQADEYPMISLTDDELAAVMTAAQPIAPDRRDAVPAPSCRSLAGLPGECIAPSSSRSAAFRPADPGSVRGRRTK